ncbi:MAG: hypothetical protein ACREEL_14720 [Stellaceae bacterium]
MSRHLSPHSDAHIELLNTSTELREVNCSGDRELVREKSLAYIIAERKLQEAAANSPR